MEGGRAGVGMREGGVKVKCRDSSCLLWLSDRLGWSNDIHSRCGDVCTCTSIRTRDNTSS